MSGIKNGLQQVEMPMSLPCKSPTYTTYFRHEYRYAHQVVSNKNYHMKYCRAHIQQPYYMHYRYSGHLFYLMAYFSYSLGLTIIFAMCCTCGHLTEGKFRMEELRRRFEAPNEQNRWDAPLFRVASVSVPTKGAESAGPTEDDHSRAELILNRFSSGGGGDGDMKSGKPEEVYSDKNEHCCQPAGDASEPGASAFVSISAGSTVTTATTAIHSTAAVTGPSSFKTSWRPKLKKVTKDSSGNGALGAVAGGGDSESVFSFAPSVAATAATATGGQQISFSGTVVSTQEDALASGFEPPSDALFQQIFDYLQGAVAPPPNSSTLSNQRANADLLYELDRTSQKILQTIVAHQSQQTDWSEGTPMRFLEFDRALTLHRHVGLAELQRYRRQFVQINGRNPPTSSKAIGTSFIDFLASQL